MSETDAQIKVGLQRELIREPTTSINHRRRIQGILGPVKYGYILHSNAAGTLQFQMPTLIVEYRLCDYIPFYLISLLQQEPPTRSQGQEFTNERIGKTSTSGTKISLTTNNKELVNALVLNK